jgi:hypothetical protein
LRYCLSAQISTEIGILGVEMTYPNAALNLSFVSSENAIVDVDVSVLVQLMQMTE